MALLRSLPLAALCNPFGVKIDGVLLVFRPLVGRRCHNALAESTISRLTATARSALLNATAVSNPDTKGDAWHGHPTDLRLAELKIQDEFAGQDWQCPALAVQPC